MRLEQFLFENPFSTLFKLKDRYARHRMIVMSINGAYRVSKKRIFVIDHDEGQISVLSALKVRR